MKLTLNTGWICGLSLLLATTSLSHSQTTITTGGGSANTIPVFTGSSTLGNSNIFATGGNVGIGTSSPGYALDVSGDLNFTGVIRYQGNPIPPLGADYQANLSIGRYASQNLSGAQYNTSVGFNTLSSNISGSSNVALGFGALFRNTTGFYNTAMGAYSLIQNTTGAENTGIGPSALQENTTGNDNTAIGAGSLPNITSGGSNSALGWHALESLGTGSTNTAVGSNALTGLTSGSDNVAIGEGAGDDWWDGYNTQWMSSASQNTYVGTSTMSKSDGDTNEIVIGAYALGNGSNSVTLGNTSVTSTVLRGTVQMPNAVLTGSGITFSDGSTLASANGLGSSGGSGSTSIITLGTVSTGTWNAAPIAPLYLPSTLDYVDQAQTFTGQKTFASNVGIGTTGAPAATLDVNGNIRLTSLLGGSIGSPICTGANGILTNLGCSGSGGSLTQANGITTINGLMQVTGNTNPVTSSQGAFLGWNALTGGSGEADLINNQGGGSGGIAFFNTPPTGSPKSLLMFVGPAYQGMDLQNLPTASRPPAATPILEVNGDIALAQGTGGVAIFSDGSVQSTAWNGTTLGGDYAEAVDVLGDRAAYEPGDVITIDAASPGRFIKSDSAYSRLVAGVYSTKPGLVGRRTTADRPNKEAEVPMAMMGIVPTKVSAENGPIEPGDLLVSASRAGYAMKGTDGSRMMGAVIGKALAPLKSGSGVIEVLISLQ